MTILFSECLRARARTLSHTRTRPSVCMPRLDVHRDGWWQLTAAHFCLTWRWFVYRNKLLYRRQTIARYVVIVNTREFNSVFRCCRWQSLCRLRWFEVVFVFRNRCKNTRQSSATYGLELLDWLAITPSVSHLRNDHNKQQTRSKMETVCSLLEIEKDADDNVIFSWKKYSIRFCLQKQKENWCQQWKEKSINW